MPIPQLRDIGASGPRRYDGAKGNERADPTPTYALARSGRTDPAYAPPRPVDIRWARSRRPTLLRGGGWHDRIRLLTRAQTDESYATGAGVGRLPRVITRR
jgi:hypothetical protein